MNAIFVMDFNVAANVISSPSTTSEMDFVFENHRIETECDGVHRLWCEC